MWLGDSKVLELLSIPDVRLATLKKEFIWFGPIERCVARWNPAYVSSRIIFCVRVKFGTSDSSISEILILPFFILTHQNEEVWSGGTQAMLLPESSCMFTPSFSSIAPRILCGKVSFLEFFFGLTQIKGHWPYVGTQNGPLRN